MTVFGVVFKWHGPEFSNCERGSSLGPIGPSAATTADPCNNVSCVASGGHGQFAGAEQASQCHRVDLDSRARLLRDQRGRQSDPARGFAGTARTR
jgi:hypothetical protein